MLIYTVMVLLITALAVVMAYATNFFSDKTDMLVFFIILTLYGLSVINFSFLVSPFFNNPKVIIIVYNPSFIAADTPNTRSQLNNRSQRLSDGYVCVSLSHVWLPLSSGCYPFDFKLHHVSTDTI